MFESLYTSYATSYLQNQFSAIVPPQKYSISEAVETEDCNLHEFIYTKLVIQIYVKERCFNTAFEFRAECLSLSNYFSPGFHFCNLLVYVPQNPGKKASK